MRAQIDKPAEDVGIAAQLIERTNGGMLLTKIDQKVAGDGTILTGRGWSEGGRQGVDGSSGTAAPTDVPAERSGRASRCASWYGPDVLRHSFRILLIDLERSDLRHRPSWSESRAWPISCMRAGRLTPARTISEANVWRNRWGLAFFTPVVRRWYRNKERNPAGVIRAPRAGPLRETNRASVEVCGRSSRR